MEPDVEKLADYIADSPSPYHAVETSARLLDEAGFVPHEGVSSPDVAPLGYLRSGGALIAWRLPEPWPSGPRGFRIIGAHTDSPNLRLRPNQATDGPLDRLLVEPYGGLLRNSWLNRELGLSGRVFTASPDDDTPLVEHLIMTDEAIAVLPQLAIHLDREANNSLKLNPQTQLHPVWGIAGTDSLEFGEWLAQEIGVERRHIASHDLMLHDVAAPSVLGPRGDLLASPRLDNLCSCFGALRAISDTSEALPHGLIVALFDHEEVGSESATGARSALLGDLLTSLAGTRTEDEVPGRHSSVATPNPSVFLSADMAHGFHPNHPDVHEPVSPVRCGGGPVIKINVNQRYATDAERAAEFAALCDGADIPFQRYSHRADLGCGSTIGPAVAHRLGVSTVDVGVAQLSMHSARELMATADIDWMLRSFALWIASPLRRALKAT